MIEHATKGISSQQTRPASFRLLDWHVIPTTLCIEKAGKKVKLEPKVMQVLCYFVEHQGEVVSRATLEDQIWHGRVVGYEALTNTIIKLRRAFKDSAKNPLLIETIPKTGYRLIAEVEKGEVIKKAAIISKKIAKPTKRKSLIQTSILIGITLILLAYLYLNPSTQEQSLPLPDEPSIAVMPFLNISNDAQQSYFSDGITEDIITDLSNVSGLFVIARSSVFSYKDRAIDVGSVARKLGVQYIVQGSVRKNKDNVRINVELIDSLNQRSVWAQRYDAKPERLFELQNELTRQIVSALSMRLGPENNETIAEGIDLASYDEFLKGWSYYWRFSREDFAIAEQHFRKALQIDANNTRAHAGLALIYWQTWNQKWHNNLGNQHAGWIKAYEELQQALDPPTALALSTQSAMLLFNRRYKAAVDIARQAIDLNKNQPLGYLAYADVLSYTGQPGKAIEQAKLGMRLDPNFVAPYLFIIGRSQFEMGLYESAVKSLEQAASANSSDIKPHIVLLASYGHLGELEKASTTLTTLNTMLKKQKLREFRIDWLKNRWPYRNKSDRDQLLEGLEKAQAPKW